MAGAWAQMDPELFWWRDSVREALLSLEGDAVVFTHFVAINVAVGAATGDDSVGVFRPGHVSCTVVDHDGTNLTVVELGQQDDSVVA